MSEKWECLLCGKEIDMWDEKCPYCGENQFGEKNEYYPTALHCAKAKKILNKKQIKTRKKKKVFTDTEKLMFGLYPKAYKNILKLKVFGKMK